MKIAITGGGTGGHLAIARSIKNELISRGIEPIYIGSVNGQDKAWFEDDTDFSARYFLNSRGVVNKGIFGKIKALYEIFRSVQECKKIFKKHKVNAVFSVGGYSSAPASYAALAMRKKLFIHEQNAVVGKLNQTLQKRCTAFFSSYHNSPVKDYPVDIRFFENARIRTDIKTVIFLGGSQGAVAINNFALTLAPILHEKHIRIIHQTGRTDFERVQAEYKEMGIQAEVFDFKKDLLSYITQADFALSRAGASTLWELSANALPTFFIPYPHAAADHQYYNAKFLEEKELCWIKRENNLEIEDFLTILEDEHLETKSAALKKEIAPQGAKKIVDYILENKFQ